MSRTSKPHDLERTVQKSGIARLSALGVVLHRRNVALVRATYKGKKRVIRAGHPGQSDTYGWILGSGRHVEIEWKRDGEKPSQAQIAWLKLCCAQGAIAFWADNVTTAENVMRAILRGGRIVWRDGCNFDVEIPECPEPNLIPRSLSSNGEIESCTCSGSTGA